MKTLSELLIAEVTEHEFKSDLEIKKPKSWLKTVSAFANGIGGSLYFGVANSINVIGLLDVQKTAEEISRLIKERCHRLDFIERRGSGFKKIRETTAELYNYTDDFAPTLISTRTAFYAVLKNMNYNLHGDTTQVERTNRLLEFCTQPRTRDEMQQFIEITNREHFRKTILKPLLDSGKLRMTIPDKPNSRNQKYIKS